MKNRYYTGLHHLKTIVLSIASAAMLVLFTTSAYAESFSLGEKK